jgi:oligosaccharide repeat unit polymerase
MNNIILIGNSVLYIGTFLIYQYKAKRFTLGSFVLLIYATISLAAIDLYHTPDYKNRTITVFPFIYLYVTLMLLFCPLLKFSEGHILSIKLKYNGIIKILSFLTIVTSFIIFLVKLPAINFSNLTNPEYLALSYLENGLDSNRTMQIGLMNLIGFLATFLGPMVVLLLIYNFLFIRNKVITIGLICVILIRIIVEASMGHRGVFMSILFDMAFVYFCFRKCMTKKLKKGIIIVFTAIVSLMGIFFMAISIGRAENSNADTSSFLLSYAGQSFINFNTYGLDIGDTREGDRTFPLVKTLLGMPTAKNYMDRRDMYKHLKVDDSIFSTFIGDFTIDFGPFFAFIIVIIISFLFSKALKPRSWHFGHLLLLMVLYNITTTLGLYRYADIGGNLILLLTLSLYFIFNAKQSY